MLWQRNFFKVVRDLPRDHFGRDFMQQPMGEMLRIVEIMGGRIERRVDPFRQRVRVVRLHDQSAHVLGDEAARADHLRRHHRPAEDQRLDQRAGEFIEERGQHHQLRPLDLPDRLVTRNFSEQLDARLAELTFCLVHRRLPLRDEGRVLLREIARDGKDRAVFPPHCAPSPP